MSEMVCDVCGTTNDVSCEVLMKGQNIDRVYHLCSHHWMEVYRRCLDDFVEQNEYKVNSYLKLSADQLIVSARHAAKLVDKADEDGSVDIISTFSPVEIRTLRPYDGEGCEGE